jgi:hypothetical protein
MQFGGGPEDVLLVPDTEGDLQQGGGVVIRFYSTETGNTPLVDLRTTGDTPVTYITTSNGTDGRAAGQIPPFLGPDAVYEMWAGADNQPRFLMQASNLGSVLGTANEGFQQHIGEVNGHSTRLRNLLDVDSVSVEAATDGQALLFDLGTGQWGAGDVTGGGADVAASDTLWVAASDAPAGFGTADYTCDGTADQVQINLALNNAFGFRVGLSPGTFNLSAPVTMLGNDDVDIEASRYLFGSGTYATKLVVGSGVANGVTFGQAVCPHISDLTITVGGASHGIYSTKSTAPNAGLRSFFHGSIRNIVIKGPWDNTHSGWGMRLGSGFRYVVENVEVSGVLNGIMVLNEDAAFNCGDATFTRCFVEITGNAGVAYQVAGTAGIANQISFDTCHAIAQPANSGTICWKFEGSAHPAHIRTTNCNAEQFATTVQVGANAYDIDVDLVHVTLRTGSTLFDLEGYGSWVRCGLAYVEAGATVTLVDDDNAYGIKPNVVGPVDIYASTGSTVNADIDSTVVLRDIVSDGPGTVSASVKRPRGVVGHKTATLTDAATITIDASQGDDFRVTLAGNRTMAAPTNPTDGQRMTVLLTQDGTGTRTMTWNSAFTFGTLTGTLTTTANRRDLFEFVYNSSLSKWLVLQASKNLT